MHTCFHIYYGDYKRACSNWYVFSRTSFGILRDLPRFPYKSNRLRFFQTKKVIILFFVKLPNAIGKGCYIAHWNFLNCSSHKQTTKSGKKGSSRSCHNWICLVTNIFWPEAISRKISKKTLTILGQKIVCSLPWLRATVVGINVTVNFKRYIIKVGGNKWSRKKQAEIL